MTTPTVLLADDDRGIRTVVSHALSRAGMEVRSTGNAATLWRWVSDGDGDLVITDVLLPDENGLDLVPRIRKLRPWNVRATSNTTSPTRKPRSRGSIRT